MLAAAVLDSLSSGMDPNYVDHHQGCLPLSLGTGLLFVGKWLGLGQPREQQSWSHLCCGVCSSIGVRISEGTPRERERERERETERERESVCRQSERERERPQIGERSQAGERAGERASERAGERASERASGRSERAIERVGDGNGNSSSSSSDSEESSDGDADADATDQEAKGGAPAQFA